MSSGLGHKLEVQGRQSFSSISGKGCELRPEPAGAGLAEASCCAASLPSFAAWYGFALADSLLAEPSLAGAGVGRGFPLASGFTAALPFCRPYTTQPAEYAISSLQEHCACPVFAFAGCRPLVS